MKRLLIIFVLLLTTLSAQNFLFEKDQSGFNLETGYQHDYIRISPGYVHKGVANINFHYQFPIQRFDPEDMLNTVFLNGLGADIKYRFRLSDMIPLPLDLSLKASYFLFITGYDLYERVEYYQDHLFEIGTDLLLILEKQGRTRFIPSLGIKYRYTDYHWPPHIRYGQAPDHHMILFPVRANFIFNDKFYTFLELEMSQFRISPIYANLNLGIGYIIPRKK